MIALLVASACAFNVVQPVTVKKGMRASVRMEEGFFKDGVRAEIAKAQNAGYGSLALVGVRDEMNAAYEKCATVLYSRMGNPSPGYLDAERLGKLMEMVGEPVSEEEAADIIKSVDANNDGQINWVEWYNCLLYTSPSPRDS